MLLNHNRWAPGNLPENALYSKSNKQLVRQILISEKKIKGDIKFIKSSKNIVDDYNDWQKKYPSIVKALFTCRPGELGPGEAMLYFIFDDIEILGTRSTVDLIINKTKYVEVKAVTYSNNYLTNFKFGISADKPNTDFIKNVNKFLETFKSLTGSYPKGYDPVKPSEISINSLKDWEKYDLTDLSSLSKNVEIELVLKQNGDVQTKIDNKKITNLDHKDAINKLKNINKNFKPGDEIIKISTLKKIKDMWRRDILKSPIAEHPFLFFDINKHNIINMIELNKNNLDVHRITRGYVTIKLKV